MKKMLLLFSSVVLALTGYSQAGKPDLSFGNGGIVSPAGGSLVAVQSDGKIITAGTVQGSVDLDFRVARYNADGSPDLSFNGNGSVVSDFGLGREKPNTVLIQPDGKIVVSGTSAKDSPPDYRVIVARYNTNGTLDQSFHGVGFNSSPNVSSNGYLALEANGNILVAGDFSFTRFKSNGDVDSSLGRFGRIETKPQLTANYAIALQPDGKILIGGLNLRPNGDNSDFGIVRYNQNGSVDSSFGTNGLATTAILDNAVVLSLYAAADGKIMVAGTAGYSVGSSVALALARYNANGTPDNSFAGSGFLTTSFGGFPRNLGRVTILPQPDSKMLVAINNYLARFQPNGLLDVSFHTNGIAALGLQNAVSLATRDNRAYVGGSTTTEPALGSYQLDATPQNGLFYKYFEGTWTTLPDFNSLTPVKTGNTANINLDVRTPGRNDNFAFIWRGFIKIPASGTYTFETVSDDGSKLYFDAAYSANGIALVNNDGVHAATAATGTVNVTSPGSYPITFTYFEKDGGESMQVYWTGPGIPRQLIPNTAFGGTTTPPPTEGLNYKYYEGTWNTLPDFTMLTPVKTGNTPNIDLGVRTPGRNDNFAFVWEGTINIPAPGDYTFTTTSDDGSKLYFNSQYVPSAIATINNDGLHAPTAVSATVNVPAAGAYPIAITFFEKDGGEAMSVSWSGPGFTTQPIPDNAFSKAAIPAKVSGLTYKLYEGSFDFVPDFSTLVPIKTGNTPNVDIGVRPSNINDNFAFLWEGFITIPTSGTHEFSTLSDDGSRVEINGVVASNNGGSHGPQEVPGRITLAAGTYPIKVSYFDKTGGQVMELYWRLSGNPGQQLVPDAAFTTSTVIPPTQENGLNYKYYEGNFNALPDFSLLTPVKTGVSAQPDISVRRYRVNDRFAFVWEGNITLPTPGAYTFELVSDDGSRFYFDGGYSPSAVPLINNDGLHAPVSATATVNASGTHQIAISYFDKEGGETFQLYWTGPGIARELVPASAFTRPISAPVAALNKDAVALQLSAPDANGSNITRVYPNPFADRFMLNFYNEKAADQITIAVYDINGKQLYNQYAGKLAQGKTSMMIDLKNKQLKDGIYFVTIMKNGVRSQTMKLVKQR